MNYIKRVSLYAKSSTYFISISIVALLTLGQLSCRLQNPKDKIIYAMPITIAAMPAYIALEKGFWKREGLEVDAKMFSSGRLALDALLAKNAEVMSVSETPLVHAILKGNAIYIVSTVTEHQEVKLIVRTDHGISKPSDLKGKKIASLPGTNSDYFMYEFFKENKISLNEVKIINLSPPDMVTALVNGDIDAYFAWEPHIYYAQSKLPQQTKVFMPGNLYQGRHCVALNQEYVLSHPDVVEKLIRGFIHAEKFIRDNPEEAVAITSKFTGVPKEALKKLLVEYKTDIKLDSSLVSIMTKEAKWAIATVDSTSTIPDFNKYVYYKSLNKIAQLPVLK